MKYIFIFDLDGTLVPDGSNEIYEPVRRSIEELKTRGHYVTIATGRTLIKSLDIVGQITPNLPICCMDGRIVFDCNRRKIISYRGISIDRIMAIQDKLGKGYYVISESPLHIYAPDARASMLFSLTFNVKRKYIKVNNISEIFQTPILRIYIYRNKDISPSELERNVKEVLGDTIDFVLLGKRWASAEAAGVTKLDGLQAITEQFELDGYTTVAFGDGQNDIPLLSKVNLPVAMKGADHTVISCAKHHLNSEDDLASFLKQFIK